MDDMEEKRGRLGWLGTPAARFWLWIAIILLGGLSALYAHLRPYFRQRAAIRIIEAAGGRVELEEIEYNEDNYFISAWRSLLENIFGDDYLLFMSQAVDAIIATDESMQAVGGLINLKSLTLDGEEITDAALDRLVLYPQLESITISADNITKAGLKRLNPKLLPKLKGLDLSGKNVDDELLEHYAKNGILHRLVSLNLSECGVTDEGMKLLIMSPNLEELRLTGVGVTDAGLEHIKGLSKLRDLRLANTKITDAGVKHLAGLKNLSFLDLDNSNVSDEGIEQLRGLGNLVFLSLSNTKITDACLTHVKGLGKLTSLFLWLDNTMITDAGLDVLVEMKSLRGLWIQKTKVTREGVEKFRKARPDCNIQSDY